MDDQGKFLGLRVKTIANLGAYMSTFSSSFRHISTPRSCPVSMQSRRSTARSMLSIQMALLFAGRRPERLSWSSGWWRRRAAMGIDPVDLRKKNFIDHFPHQTLSS